MSQIIKPKFRELIPKKEPWSFKGQHGKLAVIAGNSIFTGSAILNSVAALRAGAELVKILSPERAADIAALYLPDLITIPLKGDFLGRKHLPEINTVLADSDALVIGCGIGRGEETFKTIIEILKSYSKPCVVDADGIRALASNPDSLDEIKQVHNNNLVITPHANEFYSLAKVAVSNNLDDRIQKVEACAEKFSSTIILKGHIDVVSDSTRTYLNRTGNTCMTKGGFGDTLAGICASLLAQHVEPFYAACSAAFINGLAGELASKNKGNSLIASDIFDYIPIIMKKYFW